MSEELRRKIAETDRKILELVAERMHTAEKVGAQKRKKGLEVVDPEVEAAVITRAEALSNSLGLDLSLTRRLIALLIEEAVRIQDPSEKNRSQHSLSLFVEATKGKENLEDVVRLDIDEDCLPLPALVGKVLPDSAAKILASTESLETFRETVCHWLNQRHGSDLKAEQVLITPGSRSAAFVAILALISQGERAIIPSPTPPLYGSTVRLVGGREYTLHTRLEDEWNIDMGKLEQLLRLRPELMVVNVPNSPTGKVYSKKVLREMMTMAEKAKTNVLIGEKYAGYAQGFSASLLQLAQSKLVCVNSFAPSLGMATCGFGYAVSDAYTVRRMEKIMQLSGANVPEFSQDAVQKALTVEQSFHREYAKEMHSRIALALEKLQHLPVRYYRPDGGLSLFPKVELEGFDSEIFARRLLDEDQVAVMPGQAFGDYPEHFGISLSTSKEDTSRGIMRIRSALERWERE